MAASKWRWPPPRDAGSGHRECRLLASSDNPENSTPSPSLQLHRARFLAQRFRLGPQMAHVIASPAFGEARR